MTRKIQNKSKQTNPEPDILQTLPDCGELFSVFFKIGLFTFGGGYAMIPLIHREMVENRRWIEDQEIVDVLALAQTVPGAIAINAATLIGRRLRGTPGALAATAGVILPSFVTITLIAAFFARFQDEPVVQAAFLGIRPAVAALMVLAVWKVGKSAVRDWVGWLLAISAVFLVVVLRVHALYAIVGSAALGLVLHFAAPSWMSRLMKHDKKLQPDEDRNMDETPLPGDRNLPDGVVETSSAVPDSEAEHQKGGTKP